MRTARVTGILALALLATALIMTPYRYSFQPWSGRLMRFDRYTGEVILCSPTGQVYATVTPASVVDLQVLVALAGVAFGVVWLAGAKRANESGSLRQIQ